MITSYRNRGIQRRVFHYSDGDETDYVCRRCNTIVVDGVTCQQCKATDQKTAQRIAKLKGLQTEIEHSEPTELQLF